MRSRLETRAVAAGEALVVGLRAKGKRLYLEHRAGRRLEEAAESVDHSLSHRERALYSLANERSGTLLSEQTKSLYSTFSANLRVGTL